MNRREEIGIIAYIGHFDFHHVLIAELAMMENSRHTHDVLIVVHEVKEKNVLVQDDIPFVIKNFREAPLPIISVKGSVIEKIFFPKKNFPKHARTKLSRPFPKSKLLKSSFVGRHRR